MTINFYNYSCFKVQSGDFIIAFDPPSKESGLKTPRFQTDVILISHNHKAHNGADVLSLKEENPHFIINTPGEYEIKGAIIKGIESFHDAKEGSERGLNTIFTVDLEDIKICFLGDCGENKFRPETKEAIAKIDILFLPISGPFITPKAAASLIGEIEPKIIIPMHYDGSDPKQIASQLDGASKKNKELDLFLKEFSEENIEKLDKLTIKKKDINEEKMRVVALESNL